MIKNYAIATMRHLWRHRLFTFLNVLGLAIGISASWLIFKITDFEFSYDAELPNRKHIYRLVTDVRFDSKETTYGGISAPIYQAIADQVNGVDLVVPAFEQWIEKVEVPQNSGESHFFEEQEQIISTLPSYFEMKPYFWIAGSPTSAFSDPSSVVLTQSRAAVYFPGMEAHQLIGKPIRYNKEIQKTVSGVVADLQGPTEFNAKEFFFLDPAVYPLSAWTNTNGGDKLYLLLNPKVNPASVLDQINRISGEKWAEFLVQFDRPFPNSKAYRFLPLMESHFSTDVLESGVRKASKPVIYSVIGIGVFILLLACINYINLSTAQLPQRSKEIGIRKTLGGGKKHLILQMFSETVATVLLASLLAIILSKFAFLVLGDIVPTGVEAYSDRFSYILFFLILIGFCTLVSGAYPAWLLSGMQPIGIIKGTGIHQFGKSRLTLRKGLIVFQFSIAQFFIVGALLVGQQLVYTLKKDLGFDKEAVLLLDLPYEILRDSTQQTRIDPLVEEIRSMKGIRQISLGTEPLSSGYSSSPFSLSKDGADPIEQQLTIKWVDTTYLHLYQMELIAGRNLRSSKNVNEYLINETAAKAYGFENPADAVGNFLVRRGGDALPIVGVVQDFHSRDFYVAIEPAVLFYDASNFSTINIKLESNDPSQWQESMAGIEGVWSDFYPQENFNLKFYDQTIQALYTEERKMSKLINLSTGISILISCLGLFGLASLTAFQRTKEIGIRKILGAGVLGIVGLLSRDFVKLVILAIVLASPLAWYVANQWLEGFTYRISVDWWVFLLSGLIACILAVITVSVHSVKAALSNPVNSLKSE